ncbi:helix-turn-helix domain containing protein [uncultured Desulfobacter sp.]|uniref:helix-turn-helix domain-containing protein n=1 Tax=uncultured Desulfobacter sp. TaxID=240139 RepID=UPI0029F4E981|nr:helix-turn-helix domain containing protein [uncultured Desulfobacter sp.]
MGKKTTNEKINALKKYSALNPQPQKIRDALFDQDDFFDARDLVQVKYEMLRKVRVEKKTVSSVAADFGFSRPSFYQAKAAFEDEGLAGLIPKKRGPQAPHKINQQVLEFIQELIKSGEKLTQEEIAKRVEKDLGVKVHPTNIARRLKVASKKKP